MATKKTAEKAPIKTATKTVAKSAAKKAPAKAAAAKSDTKTAAKTAPTHTEIAALAHKYFVERGHGHGGHVNDWLRAEKELNS